MIRRSLAGVAGVLALLAASPTHAQIAVYDAATYAKVLQETQTALKQLQQLEAQVQQGQTLLTSLNQGSRVNGLATILEQPALRTFLPDATQYVSAAQGDLSALGPIGANAQAIRASTQLYSPVAGSETGAALTTSGNQVALSLATGQAIVQAGAARLTGLQQLQTSLGAAGDARAVMDLQVRVQIEQAMIANDQMRVQGLAMTQAAQSQLQAQQDKEQAAASSQARLSLYRAAFQ